ncbi:MAG: LysR family transcriptional regulator [Geminicoccaceae bacterium]
MQTRLPWDDLRLVLAIGRAGSLAGAARDLAIDHSTAFRRLGALEAMLGVRLFERARAGYAPTAAGEAVVAAAQRVEAEVLAAERLVAGEDLRPGGVVRLTTTDTLAGLLAPVLAACRRAYPAITLELVVTNALLTLTRRDADIALRPSDDVPGHLVGRRLCNIASAVYAVDPPPDAWVGPDESLGHLRAAAWLAREVADGRVALRCNSLMGLLAAARAGIGRAVLPCFLGDAEPALRRLGAPLPGLETGLWLLVHPDLRRVARIRAVIDVASAGLADCRERLEGRLAGPAS